MTAILQRHRCSGETADPMRHNAGFKDPCEVVRILKAQVEAKMIVTKKYQTATPDYIAGWYSGTQNLDNGLKCG